jgi:hypothetical protein
MFLIKYFKILLVLLTINLVATIAFNCDKNNNSIIEIKFYPQKFNEYEEKNVTISIRSNCSVIGDYIFELITDEMDKQIVEFITETKWDLNSEEINNGMNLTFILKADKIGKTGLNWRITDVNEQRVVKSGIFIVSVISGKKYLTAIFTIVLAILITINNINMGCQIDLDIIRSVLRKPYALIIGLCSQFIIMPLVSVNNL